MNTTSDILICKTQNGVSVFLDTNSTHANTHIFDNPKILVLVKKALQQMTVTEDNLRTEYKFNTTVGFTDLVKTDDTDIIVFARRRFRDRYSKFVRNRKPPPTKFIVIEVQRRIDGNYSLFTTYFGRLVPSFPGGKYLPEQSYKFWQNHALVYGTQDIEPDSETVASPW